jgi:hypothetical protein
MGEIWYGKEGQYDVGWLEARALGTGSTVEESLIEKVLCRAA